MSVTVESAGLTDVGRVRKKNEDQFLIADLVKQLRVAQTSLPPANHNDWHGGMLGHLFVVADGMGGLSGGEVASGLAVETISWYIAKTMPWFYRFQDGRETELETELHKAVQVTQETVHDAAEHSRFPRMGTTLTLACLLWPRLYVVHAGDSRCYIRRGDKLIQVTTDHTLAQRAVDDGVLTPEQAEAAGLGHALWNCIGAGQKEVSPELHHTTLKAGDELLLCTDGLTRRLTDDDVLAILKGSTTAELTAKALVDAANEAGGNDNITVIVARTTPTTDPNATTLDAVPVTRRV